MQGVAVAGRGVMSLEPGRVRSEGEREAARARGVTLERLEDVIARDREMQRGVSTAPMAASSGDGGVTSPFKVHSCHYVLPGRAI